MLYNGFGEHNIQGIGDKHIPLIHNVMNTDVAVAVSDRATDRLGVLFEHRRSAASTCSGGAASPADVRRAAAVARPLEHLQRARGDQDREVLRPRPGRRDRHGRHRRRRDVRQRAGDSRSAKYFPDGFDEVGAAEVFGEHLLGATTDHLRELTHEERERIFNLGYFTWVEQQGVSIEEFEARRDPAFWTRHARQRRRLGRADRRVQRPHGRPGDTVSAPASRLVCAGCGAEPARDEPYPFRCPNAGRGDDVDHVLRRVLDLGAVRFPADDAEPNPFIRYRRLLHAYHVARAGGIGDEDFCALVTELDGRVAAVDGHGFAVTPFGRSAALSDRLGFSPNGGVWVKDETGNVSGSHKARHLFGVLLQLEVVERLGLADPARAARSRDRELRQRRARGRRGRRGRRAARCASSSPPDADPAVLRRLEELDAMITVCAPRARRARRSDRRTPAGGDRRRRAALHLPGQPERARGRGRRDARLGDRGGRASRSTGSSSRSAAARSRAPCADGFDEAVALGAVDTAPRIDTVQTERRVAAEARLRPRPRAAATPTRSRTRRATGPSSCGRGKRSRTASPTASSTTRRTTGSRSSRRCSPPAGRPSSSARRRFSDANELARDATEIDVDPTGSSGLAGLVELRDRGVIGDDERVAVLFTGVTGPTTPTQEEPR